MRPAFALLTALLIALLAAPTPAAAQERCAEGAEVAVIGSIGGLYSSLLHVQVFLEGEARVSCLGFERLELSFAQAGGCVEGGRIEGVGVARLSDIGRRAYGGPDALVVAMREVACAPPPQ